MNFAARDKILFHARYGAKVFLTNGSKGQALAWCRQDREAEECEDGNFRI